MKLRLAILAAAFGATFAVTPLSAHHSFAGTYLEDAPPTKIEGTLAAFMVRNPHSFVQVIDSTLKDKDGMPVRWSIEWGAAGQLAQQGVNANSLKVGDHVIVTGSPGRNAEDHRMRMGTLIRPKTATADEFSYGTRGQTFN